jgi:hypothetical protein
MPNMASDSDRGQIRQLYRQSGSLALRENDIGAEGICAPDCGSREGPIAGALHSGIPPLVSSVPSLNRSLRHSGSQPGE